MTWAPTAGPEARQLRARVNRQIREFFHQRSVLEVETPILSRAGNSDPQIESFQTDAGDGPRFLRTSPEFPMKRLLASGSGPIYELGRVFRRGESGRNHNPEFTMLEWYRPGFDLAALMEEVADLVTAVCAAEDQPVEVARLSYREAVEAACGFDPLQADDQRLMDWARDQGGYEGALDRSACLDLLLSVGVVPGFPRDRLTLVHGFPACQCALARLDPDDPAVALRFEAFLGVHELANGYDELYDAAELTGRFESENRIRAFRGLDTMPLDHNLLTALDREMEPGCGVALGVDRMLLFLARADQLDAVIPFAEPRA